MALTAAERRGGGAGSTGSGGGPVPGAAGIDVVILAGGTARRLGGASKPDVVGRGARLLDHLLRGLESLRAGGPALREVCVVAPAGVALPDGVLRALEDPPLGGPVAGIAAGLARLARGPRAAHRPGPPPAERAAGAERTVRAAAGGDAGDPWSGHGSAGLTAVLTCDAPESWRALPRLAGALPRAGDGAVMRQEDHVQYLLGLYRTGALARAVAPRGATLRDVSVRRALGGLEVAVVDPVGREAHDLDTWEEVRAWRRAGAGGTGDAGGAGGAGGAPGTG